MDVTRTCLLFFQFTHENSKAQRYLLRGIELTIKLYKKDLLPKVAHILKKFYDYDILEEKSLIAWGEKAHKKTVGKELAEEIHAKAAPFIKWLKEAEEEESDSDEDQDDDEDDEVEVDFNDRVIGTQIILEKEPPKKKDAEPDDIDIDAI